MLEHLEASSPGFEGPFWIKITGQLGSTNKYAWEQVDDADSAAFGTNIAAGFKRSGTTAAWPAYEISGRTDVPVGAKVRAWISQTGGYWVFQASDTSTATGTAWFAGLETTDCIKLTVLSAAGRCAGIGNAQTLVLEWDETLAAWTGCCFTHDNGQTDVTFWLADGRARLQFDDVPYELMLVGTGNKYLVFAGGGVLLCNGEPVSCSDNTFRVKLECVCCAFTDYAGPGWYCMYIDTACQPVELLGDGDECDDWVYCSGPYATQAEAESHCGFVTVPCSGSPLPRQLWATVSDNRGDCAACFAPSVTVPIEYSGSISGTHYWVTPPVVSPSVGTPQGIACGQTLLVRMQCNGATFGANIETGGSLSGTHTGTPGSTSPFLWVITGIPIIGSASCPAGPVPPSADLLNVTISAEPPP